MNPRAHICGLMPTTGQPATIKSKINLREYLDYVTPIHPSIVPLQHIILLRWLQLLSRSSRLSSCACLAGSLCISEASKLVKLVLGGHACKLSRLDKLSVGSL